jgi:lipopolysaccharide export system protein LptC
MRIKIFLTTFISVFLLAIATMAQQTITTDIKINNGAKTTNNIEGKVTLSLFSQGAVQMQISNESNFEGARWVAYENRMMWKLSTGDGMKTVYAKFKDRAGEIATAEAQIELDREAPTNASLTINMGVGYTNDKNRMVTIECSADDAIAMQYSVRDDFAGVNWTPVRKQFKDQLKGEDGMKKLFVRFKDEAGNISQPVSASIYLDRLPPTNPKVTINNGDEFSKTNDVTLTLSAEGATSIFIRGEADWLPYTTSMKYTLKPEGDGERTVQVMYRDSVGNQSKVVSDAIVVDSEAPQAPKISINSGNRNTKDEAVVLKLSAIGASEMIVANDESFNGSTWMGYAPVFPAWNLTTGEGEKLVYVKFRDRVGNESDIASAKIKLDKTPPTEPKIKIIGLDRGTTKDKSGKVDLEISAVGAKYMMLSNESSFYAAKWEIYKPEYKEWELSTSGQGEIKDGKKGVFVKFRDEAGNVSETAFASLQLDTEAPKDTKLMIDMNREYCTDKDGKVTLNLFARGASRMRVSNTSDFVGKDSAFSIPYNTSYEWKLEGEDGLKSVAVQFIDEAGNISEKVVDNIILDRTPPLDAELIVNKGDTVTSDPDGIVLLRVRAKEAVLMRIANSEDFQGEQWQKYDEHNRGWKLASGSDGKRKVYVKFKDLAGNETKTLTQEIYLDRTPPKQGFVKIMTADAAQAKSQMVKLDLKAEGAVEMQISNFFDFRGAKWEMYTAEKDWNLTAEDGVKMVFAKFKDKVGNVSLPAYDKIGLDTQAPKNGKLIINGGAKFCTNVGKLVTLKLMVNDANSMMLANTNDFKDAKWEKYEPYRYNWRLEGDDGEKNVYVKFKDKAGNETEPITAAIMLDRQEPVGEEVIVNNGDACTNNPNNRVKLTLRVEGATEMAFSQNTYFNNVKWEPYKESKDYTLIGGRDGIKTVYVKFRDEAGNESGAAKGSIKHDTEAPYPGIVKINGAKTITNETSVKLGFNAKGAEFVMISNTSDFAGSVWEPYMPVKPWSLKDGAGLKTVYVKFKDSCGNVTTTPILGTITLTD